MHSDLTSSEPVHPKPRHPVPLEPAAATGVVDDGPVHPMPRHPAAIDPAASSSAAADQADLDVTTDAGTDPSQPTTGDTVVTSSVVGSATAAAPAATPAADTKPVEMKPLEVAAPTEPVFRAHPVIRAERLAEPKLVAKVVPMAKAIPTAEPVAIAGPLTVEDLIASAVPLPALRPISVSPIVVGDRPKLADGTEPPVVPLTLVGLWLWHARNVLIAANVSMFVHIGIMLTLGSIMLHSPEKPKPQPALEFFVETVKPKKIEPPKIETIEVAPVDQRTTTVASKGSGAGSAGSQGGAGGGKVGGLNLKPIKIEPLATLTTGGTGFGTDKAFGNDMLGEVGDALDPKDAKANFFGVEAKGKNFVFVVDTSGSMSRNDRYLRCRAELLRSIGALKYGQKYFVVFFNHTTFAMPERKLVEARPAQVTKTQEWCKLAVPSGGTDPWDGLLIALKLKPDAIYLLTDGDFDPAVAERLSHAQPQTKKIPVHTICFESLSGAPVMEAIAKLTNATYLYVP